MRIRQPLCRREVVRTAGPVENEIQMTIAYIPAHPCSQTQGAGVYADRWAQ